MCKVYILYNEYTYWYKYTFIHECTGLDLETNLICTFCCFCQVKSGHRLQGLPLLHRKRPCAWWQVLRLWCLGVVPSERERKLWWWKKKHVEKNMKQMLVEEFEWFWKLKAGHVDGKLVEIVGENGMTRRLQEQFRCRQGGASGRLDGPAGGPGSTKSLWGQYVSPVWIHAVCMCVYIYIYMCVCVVYVYRVYTRVLGGVLLLSPDIVGEFGFIATNPKTIYIYI